MTMAVGSGSNAPQRYQRVSLRANTSSEHNRLDACRGSGPLRRLGGFRWQPLFPDYGSAETQSALALWRRARENLVQFEIIPVQTSVDFWSKAIPVRYSLRSAMTGSMREARW